MFSASDFFKRTFHYVHVLAEQKNKFIYNFFFVDYSVKSLLILNDLKRATISVKWLYLSLYLERKKKSRKNSNM